MMRWIVTSSLKFRFLVLALAATLTAIKLNDASVINYQASLLGTPQPISQEDIEILVGKSRGGSKEGVHANSNWRYYCKLLDEE